MAAEERSIPSGFSIRHLGADRNWKLRPSGVGPWIIYQIGGAARYRADRWYALKAGEVFVAEGPISGEGDYQFVELQVPADIFSEAPDILRRSRRSTKRRRAVIVRPEERDALVLESILVKLFREQELRAAGCGIFVRASLLEILVFLYRIRLHILPYWQHYETLASLVKHSRVKSVIAYASAHCHEKLSLDALARMAGVNRTTFCQLHNTLTGTSPMNLIARTRIERARELLARSDLSSTEIAGSVGFADPPSFFRAFRHHCGMTPLAYRKSLDRKRMRGASADSVKR